MKRKRAEPQPKVEMPDAGELPEGWQQEKLGKIAIRITKGATPTSYGYEFQKTGIKFIKIENIIEGRICDSSIKQFISSEANENQKRSILKSGDILFSIAGTIGNVCLIKEEDLPANTNQAIAIIRGTSHVFDPSYLQLFLKSRMALDQVTVKARGGAMNNVSLDDVRDIIVSYPSFTEQHQLVAQVETLLEHVNTSRDRLSRVTLIMKWFRQAVLASAFNGKLTEDWRKGKSDKETLPEGWEIKKLRDITKRALTIKPESEPNRIFGYVDISSINNDMNKISDFKKIRGEDAPSRARQSIQPYDVLFSNVRTYLRNIAMVPDDLDVQVCSTGFTVLRSDGTLLPKFLFYYTLTNDFINVVTPQQTGSNYPATTDRVVKDATIPLPPLAEQHEIVRRVGMLFEHADAIDREVVAAGRRCERLTQAVLGKAFHGELTTNDPKAN